MKLCDTCGGKIGDDHPFTVCPQCLFASALKVARPLPASHAPSPAAVPRLSVREDFFRKYDLLETIAQGGQGEIWKVWDSELHRCVAMKRLTSAACASEPAVYRFLSEAQIAGQLEHPGILPIYDVGLDPDGRPFYATQLLPGTTLRQTWQPAGTDQVHRDAPGPALRMLIRVCEIMAYAHARGVIHRDLKPTNVMVGAFGDVRVIDWGSAHVLGQAKGKFEEVFVPLNRDVVETDRGEAIWGQPGSPLSTAQTGQPVTLLFVPPELVAGHHDEPGPETDVYSVGVMLYELLTGRLPYSISDCSLPDAGELRKRILAGPPKPVRSLKPACSHDLAAICEKAMAHSRTDRYCSMEKLAEDIRASLELRPVMARKPGSLLVLQKWALRHAAHLLVSIVFLGLLSGTYAIVKGLAAERNAARQLTALRSADLASRQGQWRKALEDWERAEQAGYADLIHLGLRRAEALTVLGETEKAGAILRRLAARSDLGNQRGAVLLNLGEHELFDNATFAPGVQHVRDSLSMGLSGADLAFASGLLADSTPEALDCFEQTLKLNPYHHAAHRYGLGLQFLLGREADFKAHAKVFKILYPDDSSPGFLEAAQLAMRGELAKAQAELETLRDRTASETLSRMAAACRSLAAVAGHYDLDAFLNIGRNISPTKGKPGTAPGFPFALDETPGATLADTAMRIPRLPCVRNGLLEGSDAIRGLVMPFMGDIDSSIEKIRSSWRRHPEAFMPLFAGLFLESRQPTNGMRSLPILKLQAEMFQMSADSPSAMPNLGRLARYLAAQTQFEAAQARPVNTGDYTSARQACLANVHKASLSEFKSARECESYFQMALALKDHDVCRVLLRQWEQASPDATDFHRAKIQLDLAAGAAGGALHQIDQLLSERPTDAWALEQRKMILEQLKRLLIEQTSKHTETKP